MPEQFKWIDFYTEFATKLLGYRANRESLISKIIAIYDGADIRLPKLGKDTVPLDIDPFTVFALFNKGISTANRIAILRGIKQQFDVKADVPNSFDGIPVLTALMSTFYAFEDDPRLKDGDIDNLWEMFECAIRLSDEDNQANREAFCVSYDKAESQFGVKWNLTMALYWIRPYFYINMDSRNRQFMSDPDCVPQDVVDLVKKKNAVPSAEKYLMIRDKCMEAVDSGDYAYKSFPEFSYNAWLNMKDIDYIGVLNYIEQNHEMAFVEPEATDTDDQKAQMLEMKRDGDRSVMEMKKLSDACKEKCGFDDVTPASWLRRGKVGNNLCVKLRYKEYANTLVSISVFAEYNGDMGARYRISLDVVNDGTNTEAVEKYHSFLDIPVDKNAGLVCVGKNNKWGIPEVIQKSQEEIQNQVKAGELMKVQLSKIIERSDDESNENYHEEILKAVEQLMPYYNKAVGIDEATYWPSKDEYDPGLSRDKWIEILNNPSVIKKNHLQMLAMMMELGGESTCVNLANRYGKTYPYYNSTGQDIGRQINKAYGIPLCPDEEKERFFPIPFVGRRVIEGGKPRYSWKIRDELFEALESIDLPIIEKEQEKTMNGFGLNTILYGPPGTGKTYNTVRIAVSICEPGLNVDEMEYEDVFAKYKELKKEGRIEFTTFHQSYGYEEFIEGIKPVMVSADNDNQSKDIQYDVVPGIFKTFCKNAKKVTISTNGATVEKTNPKVWCLMLDGTGESKLKNHCFTNNEIRIGWPKLPERITYETEVDTEFTRSMLLYFQDEMEIGDLVVIQKKNDNIDAVGIITSDYIYDTQTFDGEWPRKRTVKWMATGIDENLYDLNGGKHLGRPTIYLLGRINADDIIKLVNGKSATETITVEQETKPHVFIIDEINRGNISKIFGELITLIENTKREGMPEEASAALPYSGEQFSVPSNVYILGTMNTADRSIALMDTALRRRFDFVEMMPDVSVLDGITVSSDGEEVNISRMLRTINQRIEYLYDREHTIGHAFFIKLRNNNSKEVLADIFRNNVVPLLQEYFYEDYEKIQLVLGDNMKSSQDYKFIKDETYDVRKVFKGSPSVDNLDIVEKKYVIQNSAFDNIHSYKEIGDDI